LTKLIFLGTAQDGGVPQAGCNCRNCKSVNRYAASVALIDGDKAIIVDVSPDFRLQYRLLIKQFPNVRLNAIYLTHAHWGHYGGLMLMGKEGMNVKGLPVYLSESFDQFLTSNEPFAKLFSNGHLIAHLLEDRIATLHGITPVSVPHRDEYSDTFAFLIDLNGKKVLYMPDVDKISIEVGELIRSVDLAIIDATFYNNQELKNRDMTKIPHPRIADTVKRFADISERIIFTHFNHTNKILNPDSDEYNYCVSKGFRIANDGDILE